MGGVDLSLRRNAGTVRDSGPRPCGRGGFKRIERYHGAGQYGPRPCGRGGFKHENALEDWMIILVPARVGGVDLSWMETTIREGIRVPARVGGVDLSTVSVTITD